MKRDMTKEIGAGVAVFLATSYIVVVNPVILSQAGMPFDGVVTATVMITFVSTLLMGLFAKNPIVVAPGMGLNAFFTYSVVKGMGVGWEVALGMVFWSGIFFLILSAGNVRVYLLRAIPVPLRYALSCGIGLFIALIGLVNAGVVVDHPATLITIGGLNITTGIFWIGLFITAALLAKKIPGAMIIGIIVVVLLSIPVGRFFGDSSMIMIEWNGLYKAPSFDLFFKADLIGSLKLIYIPVIFSFIFTDIFDSLSTFMAVSYAGDLVEKDGSPRNLKRSLLVDAISTTISGLFGSSAGTSYIESAVGVKQGGRTGLVAVTAALLFLPLLFFSPLLSIIPKVATAPVLVLVGASMMGSVKKIEWEDFEIGVPAFIALLVIPLTYSITNGIVWSILSFLFIKIAVGKIREINLSLWILSVLMILSFLF